MSIIKRYLGTVVCVLIATQAWGQAASSPFSTFGIGEYYGNALAHNQGMAGMGVSQPQAWFLNNQNPALLVYNQLTVFSAGVIVESRKLRGDTTSIKNVGGNLNYLVTAFPVKPNRWTTSLGLMPFTAVNYKFNYTGTIDGSTTTFSGTEQGSGGLTQLYWSNGVKINDDFAIGLKTTYIFSSVTRKYTNQLPPDIQPVNYVISIEERNYVKDFSFSLGGSYSKDSLGSKHYRLSIGAVGTFAADLKAGRSDKIQRLTSQNNPVQSVSIDTISGRVHIPASILLGISLSKGEKWAFGTEFGYQNWSTFRTTIEDDQGLQKAWKIALGGELTPDPAALENFLKRITYRTGVSMEQYPFLANNKHVKDFGINFGLSLPAGRSSLDLAVKVGKRGNKSENILEESYFKVYFGITFNDRWFIKRKFD